MKTRDLIILGLCIILSSIIIGFSIIYCSINNNENNNRYQFIKANEQNMVIFDSKTGKLWKKYIHPIGGPDEWEEDSPIIN